MREISLRAKARLCEQTYDPRKGDKRSRCGTAEQLRGEIIFSLGGRCLKNSIESEPLSIHGLGCCAHKAAYFSASFLDNPLVDT